MFKKRLSPPRAATVIVLAAVVAVSVTAVPSIAAAKTVENGLPDDYYDTYAGKVRALKTSDVNAAAKEVVRADNLTWIVVGDRAKIETGVRELNLGEFRLIDVDGKIQ